MNANCAKGKVLLVLYDVSLQLLSLELASDN
jgi:hypothetical protein